MKVFVNGPNCTHKVNRRFIYGLCLLPAGATSKNGKPCTAWCKLVVLMCVPLSICVYKRKWVCEWVCVCVCSLGLLRRTLKHSRATLKLVYIVLKGKFPLFWKFHYKWPQWIFCNYIMVKKKRLLKCHKVHHMKGREMTSLFLLSI